jgi:hypothetical protein
MNVGKIIIIISLGFALSGCASMAPMTSNAELTPGPVPEVVQASTADPLACVGASLTKGQRRMGIAVIEAPDRTGRVNFNGNDAMGYFNTQGAANMLVTTLKSTGVRVIDMSPAHRQYLEWQLKMASAGMFGDGSRRDLTDAATGKTESVRYVPAVKGTILPVRYAMYAAITTTDPLPGGGVKGGAYGAAVGYNQNRMLSRIDVHITRMPYGESSGGDVVAAVAIKKQIVQDQVVLELTRLVGPTTGSTLVNLDAGLLRREPMQYSTGEMLDLAAADSLAQVFHIKHCQLKDDVQTVAVVK